MLLVELLMYGWFEVGVSCIVVIYMLVMVMNVAVAAVRWMTCWCYDMFVVSR